MKTINGWDQFVADSRREPVLVPLWDGKTATVHFPTKRLMKQIFDDQGNLVFDDATRALFGDENGQRLLDESEDEQGAPLERMVLTVLHEFGLVGREALDRLEPARGEDVFGGEGEGPNPGSSSSSSTDTGSSSNGTSPSAPTLTSSTSSVA